MDIYTSVVVVNRPGAGGTVGTRAVKDAEPDGYTIGSWSPGIITSKADGRGRLRPQCLHRSRGTGLTEIGMAVLDASEIDSPQTLIEKAKAEPNSVVVATNIGLPVHFIPMMFTDEADSEMKFVQIGGGSKRLASILGGHTDTALFSVSEFKRYEESVLRPLFLYVEERDPGLPDTPTAKESGVDLSISVFRVWLVPAGLEPEVEQRLQEILSSVLQDDEVRQQLADLSIDPAWLPAQEIEARLDEMTARIEPLVEAARATAN